MSIRRDLVIKVSNGTATLDMPLQIYEKDHGIELRFKLMDYKYKYDKDPENILNSNKEDILEAYTTIVNPSGYELAQINGEVVDDTIKFMIEDSYTDELEELGIYQLQIHVKCTHSEFSIPPVRFEVLERLKGEKVVTDGDDEVDNSDIIDGSTKFVDDETGKLIIQWQKGDTISSVRLNAMVEVINNAVDEEAQRQLNEAEREQQELEREQQELERENRLQVALNSVDARVDESMNEYETRFNALTASQQQDMEVIDARDGEVSLKARLDRDVRNPLQVYEDVEGSYITCDSTDGYAQNVELLGNTIQDVDNLADIRSVGDKVEDQELYEIPVLSCGENLFDKDNVNKLSNTWLGAKVEISDGTGEIDRDDYESIYWIKIEPSTTYTIQRMSSHRSRCGFTKDEPALGVKSRAVTGITGIYPLTVTSMSDEKYLLISGYCDGNYDENITEEELLSSIQINVGTTLKPYTAYQSDRLAILSPVQLEKVGDVADRIVCKDGVWGVEKNVETLYFKDLKNPWAYPRPDWVNALLYGIDFVYDDYNMTRDSKKCISNKFSIADNILGIDNPNSLGLHATSNNIYITVPIDINTSDTAKEYVKDSYIKYATTQPTFIPLPHDQQVKLRTFAGKTNISFLTEIEGTIKAQVPKSISATVNTHTEQINNLNKELDKVKKLEESTVSTVVTESAFTTVTETTNGYFEDVKLEGKTLVNLMSNPLRAFSSKTDEIPQAVIGNNSFEYTVVNSKSITYFTYELSKPIEFNKQYTLFYTIEENSISSNELVYGLYVDGIYGSFISNTISGGKLNGKLGAYSVLLYSPTEPLDSNYADMSRLSLAVHISEVGGKLKVSNIMLLEGDHTQNPPEYFEGLKSVGDGVEEVSVESANRRLFDLKTVNQDWLHGIIDTIINSNNIAYHSCEAFDVSSLRNKQIYIRLFRDGVVFNSDYIYVCVFDENKQLIGERVNVYNTAYLVPSKAKYMRIMAYIATYESLIYIDRDEYCVSLTPIKDDEQLVPHQSNKKPLLYYNPTTQAWERPILREWDSIEKHSDGKYYYHKRSGEVVLNGSEEWNTSVASYTNVIAFYTTTIFDFASGHNNKNLISDKFATSGYSDDEEGITSNDSIMSIIRIKIKPSKLSTQDVAGLKTWLQANPTTVVYQLATEEVYECINIDLITYENETNFMMNAGAITPKSTLKVICNITNVVRELQQKVSNLENYIQHVMIDALNNALNE